MLSLAVRSLAAESTPLDEVRAAVALLADKTNYSWSATVDQNDGRTSSRASGGKFQKDRGIFYYMQDGVGAQLDVYLQGGKVAMKMGGTWKTFDEEFPDQRLRWIGRFKTPSAEASDLVEQVKELKKTGDAYIGDLAEDGVRSHLFAGRRRGNGPRISDGKGSVTFWIKDGILSKFTYSIQGKVRFNGGDMDLGRTTTVEIKEVGTTKLWIPEAASERDLP